MSAAAKRLVVFGGGGFLGTRICKVAAGRGWDVASVSRSSEPRWDTVTDSDHAPEWAFKVSWETADIFHPVTYESLVKGADYVVHTMGILLEVNYKDIVSGRQSSIQALRRLFDSHTRDIGAGPLDKPHLHDIKPNDPRLQNSYEAMNRDSAVGLARYAARHKATFGYISACSSAPLMPPRYIATKREAEVEIAKNFPDMRSIFFRPPFLYDPCRPLTMSLAAIIGTGTALNNATGRYFSDFLGAAGTKPLPADTVAEAVVEGLSNDGISGPVEVPEIEELANKAWRKGML